MDSAFRIYPDSHTLLTTLLVHGRVITHLDHCGRHLSSLLFLLSVFITASRVILLKKKNQIISLLSKIPPRSTHFTQTQRQSL